MVWYFQTHRVMRGTASSHTLTCGCDGNLRTTKTTLSTERTRRAVQLHAVALGAQPTCCGPALMAASCPAHQRLAIAARTPAASTAAASTRPSALSSRSRSRRASGVPAAGGLRGRAWPGRRGRGQGAMAGEGAGNGGGEVRWVMAGGGGGAARAQRWGGRGRGPVRPIRIAGVGAGGTGCRATGV